MAAHVQLTAAAAASTFIKLSTSPPLTQQAEANPTPIRHPCAAPNQYTFNSSVSGENFTYTLNTSLVSQADAEHHCACFGGHLVSYTSLEEQQVGAGGCGAAGARRRAAGCLVSLLPAGDMQAAVYQCSSYRQAAAILPSSAHLR